MDFLSTTLLHVAEKIIVADRNIGNSPEDNNELVCVPNEVHCT